MNNLQRYSDVLQRVVDANPDDEFLVADGFDNAIIGTHEGKLVYSTKACINILAQNMSYEDAIDFFYFNVEGSYMGEKTPIFVDDYYL